MVCGYMIFTVLVKCHIRYMVNTTTECIFKYVVLIPFNLVQTHFQSMIPSLHINILH